MKKFKNTATIEVLGASFKGVKEMIRCARSERPKNGVYVGIDEERYPCFDVYDCMYDNRRYTNLVFAQSREELKIKMSHILGMRQLRGNYYKLTGALHPMAYWGGDTNNDVLLTDSADD